MCWNISLHRLLPWPRKISSPSEKSASTWVFLLWWLGGCWQSGQAGIKAVTGELKFCLRRLEDVKLSISFQSLPGTEEQEDAVSPSPAALPVAPPAPLFDGEQKQEPSSCQFTQQQEKQKLTTPRSSSEDQTPRQYTVVSKMPRDTTLQVNVKCPKCNLKFFKPEILEEHLKLHEGKKAKQCTVCSKSFNSNYHFKTHMRTHSQVKPYCCVAKVK